MYTSIRSYVMVGIMVLVAAFFMVGCAEDTGGVVGTCDDTPPTVGSTDPLPGAIGVPLNGNITATFSEEMDPSTITPATFTLSRGTASVAAKKSDLGPRSRIRSSDFLFFSSTLTPDQEKTPGSGEVADYDPNGNLPSIKNDDILTPVAGTVTYSGLTATFNPSNDLVADAVYTASITTGATDLTGNPIAVDYVWTFTSVDNIPPTVSSTQPVNNATVVPLNQNISAAFSEEMDPATITDVTMTLRQGTSSIPGVVSYVGVTATFNPSSDLAPSTVYTATIETDVQDLSGNSLASSYVWTFTTGATTDVTAPTVSSTQPANSATGVSLNQNIAASFSEAMDPLTITTSTLTLHQGTSTIAGTVTYAGVTATFNPTAQLLPSTLYTATITTGVEDLAGNEMANDYVWTFTTGTVSDETAPTVSSTIPSNEATGVPLGGNIAATFSEAMDPLTVTTATLMLRQGTVAIAGTVTYAGVTATFNPNALLSPNTLYTATITTGVEDLAGNEMASDYVWTFTTGTVSDETPPTVSSTIPLDDATDVPVGGNIAATFSEAMNPLTITTATLILRQGLTTIAGTVTYAGVTATFNPNAQLSPSTLYTATITTGVQDLAGNEMANSYVWSFTTGTISDETPPTVSSTIPMDEATDVPLGGNIAATFSEAMDPSTITTTTLILRQGIIPIAGTVTSAGVTATFNPTAQLLPSTLYTVTITTGVKDLAGNEMASDYVWTFTTGIIADVIPPTVSSTIPLDEAIDVPVGGNVSATFSEAMDPLTITTATLTLRQGIATIAGTVTYAGLTATFNPTVDLLPSTVYSATITTDVTDLAGNEMLSDYVWTFTTEDLTPPEVVSTTPDDEAIDVSVSNNITAMFSEEMDQGTITDATMTLEEGGNPVSGTVSYSGVTATFNPDTDLASTTLYTVTITTDVTDLAGNELVNDYVWTFTTEDVTPPEVVSTNPDDEAIDVSVSDDITAMFSEEMDQGTITDATMTLEEGGNPVSGTVSYNGVTATFNPDTDLASTTLYTATITTDVTDLAGNELVNDYVWTFTTEDVTPPEVVSTNPEDEAISVSVFQNITATFSEAMDQGTITDLSMTLDQAGVLVTGIVTYEAGVATFNPDITLASLTLYTATITTDVTDEAGNEMVSDYVWTFTTGVQPVDLGSSGSYGVLAGSTVSNTGGTIVNGDLGVSPGTEVVGFPPGVVTGEIHAGDPEAAQAKLDLTTAYLDAAGRTTAPIDVAGNIGGQTLAPGLYRCNTSLEISGGDLTLDAQGNEDAVWIFQIASTLTTTAGRQIVLSGGANAANIFWQVGSSATLGTTSIFYGTILADQSITITTGATLNGRALTRIAAVTLDNNVVTAP